jgi:S-adenosylmethionine hydrolase
MLTVKTGATLHSIPWVTAYSDVEPGEPLLHVDSAGLIAIAVREGAADQDLNLTEGAPVTLAGTGSTGVG